MSTLGEILRSLRTEKHLKQSDIAVQGITSATISQYESNRRVPSFSILQALAERLDVSVSVFFPECENEHQSEVLMTLLHQAERAERRKGWEEALEGWNAALQFCRSYHLTNYQFSAQQHKGRVLTMMGQYEEAIDTLLGLLVHPEFLHNHEAAYEILWTLGKCSRELDQWEQANTFARLAAQIVSPSDERWIRMHINMGTGYMNLGNWERSIESFHAAVTRAKEIGHGLLEAWAHVGLTTAYIGQSADECVIEGHILRAKELAQVIQERALFEAIEQNEIAYYRETGQWSKAKDLVINLLGKVDPSHIHRRAELIHEELLLAALLKDESMGEEALYVFEQLPVSGPMRGLLWLAAARYYLSRNQKEQASHALKHAGSLLVVSHYHDTSHVIQFAQLLERGYRANA